MNRFSYYITTNFIPSNKDYNSRHNLHSVYQHTLRVFFLMHYFRNFLLKNKENN